MLTMDEIIKAHKSETIIGIADSGERRKFKTGAVRDCASGKGRCDLLPLDVVGDMLGDYVFNRIDNYCRTGDIKSLYAVIENFVLTHFGTYPNALLELAKHYEDGANKYSERNWEQGIPLHCYIDSGVRHYLKLLRGDTDEPHDRAFLWNMMGAIWTHTHLPEMIDLPYMKEVSRNECVAEISQ